MTQRIVFLCSGGGGNLRFIVQALALGTLDAAVCAVFTDRECLANRFAREHGITTAVLDFAGGQAAVIAALNDVGADIVVTNVHRILSEPIVVAYRGRLVNLHYSLLPAYGGVIGTRPIEMALADGVKFIGVTSHHVDVAVDAGRPIAQAVIPVAPEDTVEDLMDTVFQSGCLSLLEALRAAAAPVAGGCTESMCIHGREIRFNPPLSFDLDVFDPGFWRRLADYPARPDAMSALS